MEETHIQRLAGLLKLFVTVTFLCNLLVLPLVPLLVYTGRASQLGLLPEGFTLTEQLATWPIAVFTMSAWMDSYTAVLALFLLFCGLCTAVILWQARRILSTILVGDTFTFGNAANMKRAAVCCFLISGAALLRTVWGFFYYGSPAPLFTYNALFCPIFLMGGLLCLVMSALFRQAAELKAENDLTI